MVWGPNEEVSTASEQFNNRFDCNDVGEVKEYVGYNININEEEKSMTFTQPVLLQSFEDEFELTERKVKTPAESGSILIKTDPENKLNGKGHTYFRSGTGKLLHMVRWSMPEMQNTVCELTMQGSTHVEDHIKAIHRAIGYNVSNPKQGWKLKTEQTWNDQDKTFKFKITKMLDSDYAKCQ
eukprot:15144378-Ditylum_brightwellii.AAC.1